MPTKPGLELNHGPESSQPAGPIETRCHPRRHKTIVSSHAPKVCLDQEKSRFRAKGRLSGGLVWGGRSGAGKGSAGEGVCPKASTRSRVFPGSLA